MATFGEDLRMERMSRGMALDDITAITKISRHHLVALEQDRFRLLPGGILNKGIVRGYTGALGLDQHAWTERFLKACSASGQSVDEERDWTAFASNVGKARIMRHEEVEARLRWLGAAALALAVIIAAFLTVRYLGLRAGWWPSLLPFHAAHAPVHAAVSDLQLLVFRASACFNGTNG
jgi:cytoskeletal protein RodZ